MPKKVIEIFIILYIALLSFHVFFNEILSLLCVVKEGQSFICLNSYGSKQGISQVQIRLSGTKGAQYEQGTIIFSIENEIKIIMWEQDICTTKYSISG